MSSALAGGTCGNPVSVDVQVSRRSANTAVAVAAISAPWVIAIDQCWVERFVRTGTTSIVYPPSATGPAKLTVSATGSPMRAGCVSAALSIVAAVMPPNGPTMLA